jgi:hypothetical protein
MLLTALAAASNSPCLGPARESTWSAVGQVLGLYTACRGCQQHRWVLEDRQHDVKAMRRRPQIYWSPGRLRRCGTAQRHCDAPGGAVRTARAGEHQ